MISHDTPATRAAYLAAEHAETECCLVWASEVASLPVSRAWSVSVDDVTFVRAVTPRGVELFAIDGDGPEQISAPCRECAETGRVEASLGPYTRGEPCFCAAGFGRVGRWV